MSELFNPEQKTPAPPKARSRILSSDWTGMNPNLIAKFYPVKRLRDGKGWEQSRDVHTLSQLDQFVVDDGYEVHCPITDGNMDITLGWTSPFEAVGTDSRAPTLSASLQAGAITPNLQAIDARWASSIGSSGIANALAEADGRSGMTKLNSTQVFSGMPPVKFTLTALFRALADPRSEVRDPITQLEEWAVPQFLADEGLIAGSINSAGKSSFMQSVFPSAVPQVIAMQYADMRISPLVIESMSKPFTVPRTAEGFALTTAVQLTLCTLTTWDRRDVVRVFAR